ncbi:DUF6714 family protein [Jeongeupia chitinilytica]|uniref:Uncharacterized protein n=1 Tax=Jeongeupia chitinilytica TaxID=1041641 RepID=A0ABQ3GXE0_9NEIS|nr:DUF6714 family protein [Jeongeupia chitinilytica]GHD57041.1 hypothetical protein GCM10007350_05130 [Jeongeupia chitinilytica]
MNSEEKQKLVQRIENAWRGIPRPEKAHISVQSNDDGVADYFAGTRWQGHSVDQLRRQESALCIFFTPAAYHYWLPAYLIAALDDPVGLDVVTDHLIGSLSPHPLKNSLGAKTAARLALLTKEQLAIVICVFEHIESVFADPDWPEATMTERIAIEHLHTLHDAM